jgi:hypothetical protein
MKCRARTTHSLNGTTAATAEAMTNRKLMIFFSPKLIEKTSHTV